MRDSRYWDIHKKIYQKLMDELDITIVSKIMNDPKGLEATLFNKKVTTEIERILLEGE